MEWHDHHDHMFGDPAPADDSEHGDGSLVPEAEDEPVVPPPGDDVDDEEALQHWLDTSPAADDDDDPAADAWLSEALGDVPPVPDDVLPTDELVDRVIAQRREDDLGL
jgi:hypothetical protein